MLARVVSALLGVPLLLLATWAGFPWFPLLVAAITVAGTWEFYRLAQKAETQPVVWLGVFWAPLFVLSAQMDGSFTLPLVTGGTIASLVAVVARSAVKDTLKDWALTVAAPLYVGGLLSHGVLLRETEKGVEWVIFALLCTFATDTSAFFVGRYLGKRRLSPRISPGKTWEGAFAGLAGGMVAALGLAPLLSLPVNVGWALGLGAAVGVFGQVGDLAESALKRSAGVKDAGALIPGHGGILDRIDSVVFTIVVVYYFVRWLQ